MHALSHSRIDWEHPPSTRIQRPALGRRLVFDAVVLASCATIGRILVAALRGDSGASARGVREFFVEGLGSAFLVWGVIAVVGLAALYCAVDALLLLRRALAERRRPTDNDARGGSSG